MATKVLKADCSGGASFAEKAFTGLPGGGYYIQADVYIPATTFASLSGAGHTRTASVLEIVASADFDSDGMRLKDIAGNWLCSPEQDAATNGLFTADSWHVITFHWDGSQIIWALDCVEVFSYSDLGYDWTQINLRAGGIVPWGDPSEIYYLDNVRIGTTPNGTELFSDDFEDGTFGAWDDSGSEVLAGFTPDSPGGCVGGGGTPTAAFVGVPTEGHAPLTVAFTDLSTGGPSTWLWDFGDGDTSALQNPTHVYTSRGLYDVTLTVT